MIAGGTLVTQFDAIARRATWFASCAGALIALGAFMRDAILASHAGEIAIRNILPTQFEWVWFALGFALMSAPVVEMVWQMCAGFNSFARGARPARQVRRENV
jgi:hypothetical protein